MNRLTLAAVSLALLTVAGCAVPAMETYQPTVANSAAVRSPDVPPMQVGEFVLAPGMPANMDRSITIRASTLRPPKGESFSKYLGDCLATELRAAGKLGSSAGISIRGVLTESKVSSGVSVGEASLGATFIAERNGKIVYRKQLRVSSIWESNFIGAIAIPEAMNQYTALYSRLVGALLADNDFRTSIGLR